jgi:hypothetical protein
MTWALAVGLLDRHQPLQLIIDADTRRIAERRRRGLRLTRPIRVEAAPVAERGLLQARHLSRRIRDRHRSR